MDKNFISLAEYAKLVNRNVSCVRKKAESGDLITARKIGRNWVINKNEKYTDNRVKKKDGI